MELSKKQKFNREIAKAKKQQGKEKSSLSQGKVLKAVGGSFVVLSEDAEYTCTAKKVIVKEFGEIYAGDNVNFCTDTLEIDSVKPRINSLIRPPVANLEQVIIVIAPKPAPDFLLVDKILVNCFSLDIQPVLVVNKCDLDCWFGAETSSGKAKEGQLFQEVYEAYGAVLGKYILSTSAKVKYNNGILLDDTDKRKGKSIGITKLKNALKGKFSCFAGQSAVGKSTLLNALFPKLDLDTGELSAKVERGKHTTRSSTIFYTDGIYVCDTPGFSLLDIFEVEANDLCYFYPDFAPFVSGCKFSNCNHVQETKCGIKEAVNAGKISKARYDRYLTILSELQTCNCHVVKTICKRQNCINMK